MKTFKIVSLVTGLSVLAMTLLTAPVSAAAAIMSMAGATNTTGSFAVTVYENTGDSPVTTAYLQLSFSQAVTNVTYDYSVGPFQTTTPSGAHAVQGSVTGQQPVARVSFTLASPGTVTASVSASTYLKGAMGSQLINYEVGAASATFTYTAPAPANGGNQPGNTTPAPVAPTAQPNNSSKPATKSAAPAANTGSVATVAGDTTTTAVTDAADTKEDGAKESGKRSDGTKATSNKSSNNWLWLLLVAALGAAAVVAARTLRPAKAAAPKAAVKKTVAPKSKKTVATKKRTRS